MPKFSPEVEEMFRLHEALRPWVDAVLQWMIQDEEHYILCGESADRALCGHNAQMPVIPQGEPTPIENLLTDLEAVHPRTCCSTGRFLAAARAAGPWVQLRGIVEAIVTGQEKSRLSNGLPTMHERLKQIERLTSLDGLREHADSCKWVAATEDERCMVLGNINHFAAKIRRILGVEGAG